MYLNTIYFGANAYGIETASKTYFGKSASELTLAESAGLAALFLLIVRPVFLFDAGFQLSFAACLGIGTLSHTFRAAFSAPFARASSVSQNTAENFSLKLQRGLVSLLSVSSRHC